MSGALQPHGTNARYCGSRTVPGCRCHACRQAHTETARAYRATSLAYRSQAKVAVTRRRLVRETGAPAPRRSLADRLAAKIIPGEPPSDPFVPVASGCWLWTGATSEGYGRIQHDGMPTPAHRVVYELLVGPVPDGLQLDHLCRVRACVNPSHLEPVTSAENTRRGAAHRAGKAT